MKRSLSLILAIAATVSAQIVPSTGNVRGPTSATDNAVARYDGTTGKLIQNSGVTIDDSGNLTVSGTGTSTFAGTVTGGVMTSTGAGYTNSGFKITNTTASRTTGWFLSNAGVSVLRDVTGAADLVSIDLAGLLRLNGYGAGTLTTDSSGNVTATSDERAKNITGTFTKGLAEVVKLTPKTYTWKEETGLNTTDEVASLTAQDLIAAGIPEAVSTYRTVADLNDDGTPKLDADGKTLTKRIDATYTVSDRAVIAALVNAIKELNAKLAALEAARK